MISSSIGSQSGPFDLTLVTWILRLPNSSTVAWSHAPINRRRLALLHDERAGQGRPDGHRTLAEHARVDECARAGIPDRTVGVLRARRLRSFGSNHSSIGLPATRTRQFRTSTSNESLSTE